MIKTYSYAKDKNVKISEHFSVYEFASTSNNPYNPTKLWTDVVYICTELIDELEKLFTILDAKEARISSGNRVYAHDKAVGGNGIGWHTKHGRAVDICFIGKDNKIIDTKIVSCVAQDMKFMGIARINNSYIHLDMRTTSARYLGDETKSYNTVTNDFYKYYGLTTAEVNKYIKIPYTVNDSNKQSEISNIPTISYQVYTDRWLPIITNSTIANDYAGIERKAIHAFRIIASNGANIKYRVHIKEINSWTPWIDSKTDLGDMNTYAGAIEQGWVIDAIQMDLIDCEYHLYYRVSSDVRDSYYSYVKGFNDYAGVFGCPIDKVQVYLKK